MNLYSGTVGWYAHFPVFFHCAERYAVLSRKGAHLHCGLFAVGIYNWNRQELARRGNSGESQLTWQ